MTKMLNRNERQLVKVKSGAMPIFSRQEITAILAKYRELSNTNLKLTASSTACLTDGTVEQPVGSQCSHEETCGTATPLSSSTFDVRDNRSISGPRAIERKHIVLRGALPPKRTLSR
jgi:hypothetical protein